MNYHEVERLRGELSVYVDTLIQDRRQIDSISLAMQQLMESISSSQPFNDRDEYMQALYNLAQYLYQLNELLCSYTGRLAEYSQLKARYNQL